MGPPRGFAQRTGPTPSSLKPAARRGRCQLKPGKEWVVDPVSGITYRGQSAPLDETKEQHTVLHRANGLRLARECHNRSMGLGRGNAPSNANANHLHREVVIGGVAFVEMYWDSNLSGRPPDSSEREVIRVLNARKLRAASAPTSAAGRWVLRMVNDRRRRRRQQQQPQQQQQQQQQQYPDDNGFTAALLLCVDEEVEDDGVGNSNDHHNYYGDDDDD